MNESQNHDATVKYDTLIREPELSGTPPAHCTSKSSSHCVTSLEEETSSSPLLTVLSPGSDQEVLCGESTYSGTLFLQNTSISIRDTVPANQQTETVSSTISTAEYSNNSSSDICGSSFGNNTETVDSSHSSSRINSVASSDSSKLITEQSKPTSNSKLAEMGKQKRQKSETFVINLAPSAKTRASTGNLQDSFQRFQKMKMEQMKQQRKMRKTQRKRLRLERAKPENMWSLRMKFIAELKKYLGVPYAKRYFTPEDPEYESKIFLDCCGLVRRALWNMQYLFGFRIGPWNQAYMFDTLPIDIEDEKDMKPGDLVFISGVYNDGVKLKNSPHNMKHIEVWLGQGQKVIGSRWQRGTVSIFDTYKFESKTYHNMVYHFKSIDTWLKGYCKSICSEHPWKLKRPVMFSEKSIFASNPKSGAKLSKKNSIIKSTQNQTTSKNKNQTSKKKKKPSNQKRPQTVHGDIVTQTMKIKKPIGSITLESGYSRQQSQSERDDEFMTEFDEMEGAEDCINDGMGQEFEQGQILQEDSDDEDEDDESPTDDEFDFDLGQNLKIF